MTTTLQDLVIEPVEECFVVANPRVGALSLLDEADLLALTSFVLRPGRATLEEFFEQMGVELSQARKSADRLFQRFRDDGWLRSEPPEPAREILNSVYFTVTRECNLACPYCYAGLKDRGGKRMPPDKAGRLLDMIREENPRCHIVLTGGEPFSHPHFFDILDRTRQRGFQVSILTNGALVDDRAAAGLARYTNLKIVQVSVDGMSGRVHATTRGESHKAAWEGVRRLIDHGVPFAVSPTLHEKNLDQAWDMAAFAVGHGGFFGPNHLKILPQRSPHDLRLSNESLTRVLAEVTLRLLEEYGEKGFALMSPPPLERSDGDKASRTLTVCGVGRHVVDIDWNGDVYPCNIMRWEEFALGNLFHDGFETIFKRVAELGVRVRSYDIPKCSACVFVGVCAGGCRAGSYLKHGSFEHEDYLCSSLYDMNLLGLLLRHYRARRDLESCKRVLKRRIDASKRNKIDKICFPTES